MAFPLCIDSSNIGEVPLMLVPVVFIYLFIFNVSIINPSATKPL